MKILYAIQGTGNGHITVAREVLPHLRKYADVDLLVSGSQVDIGIDHPVKYRLHGLCFVFGKKGGIDYAETFRRANVKQLYRDIQSLPVDEYHLVISDFEPVSAWACALQGKPCIGFSHQAAVVAKGSPKPAKKDALGKAVLKYYAPVSKAYGFHFLPYDKNVHTPIIRTEIRRLRVTNNGHNTVYLPAYSDKKIIKLATFFPGVKWEVFSKHTKEAYHVENVSVQPVNNERFIESMASSEGVLCGAGFQTPSEVLFLKKKLLAVPMKGQYEQQCNAAALKLLGVPIIKSLKAKHFTAVRQWLESEATVQVDFPDDTEFIIDEMVDKYGQDWPRPAALKRMNSAGKFREKVIKKIFTTGKN